MRDMTYFNSSEPGSGMAMSRRGFLRLVVAGTASAASVPWMPRFAQAAVDPSVYAKAEAAGFPKPRYVDTNGIRMAVFEKGDGYPVVFSHGFPELAYSWRHQIDGLAEAGFRAIAPDQRGYGRTERPEAVEVFDIHHLCGDLAGLLDALEIEKAVFCGHDWGGFVVWQMAHLHPDRVAGVIGVNTPYMPRPPMSIPKILEATVGPDNYIVFFQEPGVADKLLDDNVEQAFDNFMRKSPMTAEEFAKLPADAPERKFDIRRMLEPQPNQGELLLDENELAYYVESFRDTGFTGGINWYRNLDRNWETTEGQATIIDKPCLYVGAEDDVILPPSMMNAAGQWLPQLEKHTIADCGHWTQQEKPNELNATMVDWLQRHFGG